MKKTIGVQIFFHSDYIKVAVYFIIIFMIAFLIRNIQLRGSPLKKFFIPGLLVKIIGSLAMGVVYGFYYSGGDTVYYYADASVFNIAFKNSVASFFQLLFLPSGQFNYSVYDYANGCTFFRDSSGWMTDKVYAVLSLLSLHSYPVMSMMIAALSFSGVWALYRTFVHIYPKLAWPFAIAILFVPSVFFWGSGILKDSITFGCLGWITYCSYRIFFQRKNVIRNSLIMFSLGYIALIIKPYIILSFIPALFFWIFLSFRSNIKSPFLKVVSGPFIISISLVFGYVLIKYLGAQFEKYSLDNMMKTANDFHQWHAYLAQTQGESGYSLGEITGSWSNVLSKFPLAVNVTLFRPYLWEAHSIIILASAIESTIILLFTIYVGWKIGIKRVFVSVYKNPTIFFCFFFAFFFAFAVGFTSYNFGALVRFKIPCIPFYLIGLIILNSLAKDQRLKTRKIQRRDRSFYRTVPAVNSEPVIAT